jgi:2-keto-4-pentenoate hydratase/2-oxohepta-3-ene-1,7-dioic acid hydratase in catechol pathway
MKLVTYSRNRSTSIGLLTENGDLIDIPANWPGPNPPGSIIALLQRAEAALDTARKLSRTALEPIPSDEIELLAPIPRPGKILALAGNYAEHIAEASLERGFSLGMSDAQRQTTVPRPFLMPSTAIANPGDEIPWPVYSEQIDYEIELAVVIGRTSKCISSTDALARVAGYTIANDISARSVTFKEGRKQRPWDEFYDWLNGKWADSFCPMGPYLLTSDEVDDPQNLDLELKVKGKTRQKANTTQMIWPVADIVSFLSNLMTLEPGDVILTGTPSGVGVATGDFLKPGDIVEGTITDLGKLGNTLGPRPDRLYKPLV